MAPQQTDVAVGSDTATVDTYVTDSYVGCNSSLGSCPSTTSGSVTGCSWPTSTTSSTTCADARRVVVAVVMDNHGYAAGGFLDCDVPQVSASGRITGIVSLNAGTGGVCPQGETGSGTATSNWQSLGNHTYYQAESVPNETQFEHGSSGGSSSEDLEFPEFVAVGCSAATITDCEDDDSSPTAQYWREEVILQPVSPLQAIEGMGNVTISGLSALGLGEATLNGDVQTLGKLTTPTALLGLNTALTSSGLFPTLAASSFGGTIVSTAQEVTATPCEAGDPSSNCIIQRQPVTLTNSACTPCSSAMGSDYSATTHAFTQTGGTVNLTAGQYVLCNFDATGGTLNVQSGPLQIFVASPNSTLCSGNGYTEASGSWDGGNFIAANGIDNSLKGPSTASPTRSIRASCRSTISGTGAVTTTRPASPSEISRAACCPSTRSPRRWSCTPRRHRSTSTPACV